MDKVPMSYFGLVGEGRKYATKYPSLNSIYTAWDANIDSSEKHCRDRGAAYLDVWKFQERVRPSIPQSDI